MPTRDELDRQWQASEDRSDAGMKESDREALEGQWRNNENVLSNLYRCNIPSESRFARTRERMDGEQDEIEWELGCDESATNGRRWSGMP
jgi:hypothetical protein